MEKWTRSVNLLFPRTSLISRRQKNSPSLQYLLFIAEKGIMKHHCFRFLGRVDKENLHSLWITCLLHVNGWRMAQRRNELNHYAFVFFCSSLVEQLKAFDGMIQWNKGFLAHSSSSIVFEIYDGDSGAVGEKRGLVDYVLVLNELCECEGFSLFWKTDYSKKVI